ncbi:MAG: apolipoprotein N-acyltransferase [Actinomycetota bacterium]
MNDRGRLHERLAAPALALGSGVLVALALPPWGFWPLAFIGIALFEISLGAAPARRTRWRRGWLFGAGWMFLGMGWMVQLTLPGYLVAGAIFASLHGAAAMVAPTGRWRLVGRPAIHTLVEALRFSFPFGGVPLASLGISQAGGPFIEVAKIGGVILVTWFVFQVGVLLGSGAGDTWAALRRAADDGDRVARAEAGVRSDERVSRWAIPIVATVAFLAVTSMEGNDTGEVLRVAAVQGGGEQGTRAIDTPSEIVTGRLIEATQTIDDDTPLDGPLDLVVWPENGIDVDDIAFSDSAIAQEVAAAAARLDVPLSVGLTEDVVDEDGTSGYTNAQVVVTPDGDIVSRYDKVRRVPFGEYVPLRGLLERITSAIDQIPRDAIAGTEPAVLDLPTGERLAVVISWEVFFGGRAREGVELGGEAILNPTNGASYTGTIVQTQQVASSRLRAVETGRWVVQVSPTGFTAFISPEGEVVQRTAQREQAVLYQEIELRTGNTWYSAMGDRPIIVIMVLLAGASIALARRDQRLGDVVVETASTDEPGASEADDIDDDVVRPRSPA